jgi:hypothetical protein
MSNNAPDPQNNPTHENSAGTPANQSVRQPSDEELDRRDREKARPRRAAGPPLREGGQAASRDASPQEPPPATDPITDTPTAGSPPEHGQDAGGGATQASNAGRPTDHVGPKPSHDELDRRDRLKAGPRRAAGPPLGDDAGAATSREASDHEPPPATDPAQ